MFLRDTTLFKPDKAKTVSKTYGDSVMSVTVDKLSAKTLKDSNTLFDRIGRARTTWIVPVCFCYMRLNNDSFYFPRGKLA